MGMAQQILKNYKEEMTSELGVIQKREISLTDTILDECKDMTEEELRNLSELLAKKANCIRDDKIKKAKAKVIEAWKEYRKVYPNDFRSRNTEKKKLWKRCLIPIFLIRMLNCYMTH